MARKREHYHMAAVQVIYKRDEVLKKREMNFVLTSEDRNLTMDILNQGRKAAGMRLAEELQLENPELVDLVYLSVFYLGHMNDREFLGQIPTPTAGPAYGQ